MKKNNKRPILILRFSALGDVAMTVPVILAFRRAYPDIHLNFITKSNFTSILDRIPGLDTYPLYTHGAHKGISGLWRLRKELKTIPFVSVADLHAVLRTRILRLLFLGSGTPFKVIDKGRKEKRRLTAWKNKEIRPLKSTHERYAAVFASLGYPVQLTEKDVLPRENWPEGLSKEGEDGTNYRIGIAPFAAHPGKCYSLQKMKEVISRLGKKKGIRLYLLGGGEKEISVLDSWGDEFPHCVSVAGKMGLSEELALISNLDLMVSMDSGNGHLAAMYGLPVITIWGITHPYAGFTPYKQPNENSILADIVQYPLIPTSVYGNKAPEGYESAMDTIFPEQILQRIIALRENKRP